MNKHLKGKKIDTLMLMVCMSDLCRSWIISVGISQGVLEHYQVHVFWLKTLICNYTVTVMAPLSVYSISEALCLILGSQCTLETDKSEFLLKNFHLVWTKFRKLTVSLIRLKSE